jgi:hypothetical protein
VTRLRLTFSILATLAITSSQARAEEAILGVSGVVAAVETCLAAVGPSSTDDARLAADGWIEKPIENISKAKGGAEANRLFAKDGAGATIFINIVKSKKRPVHHCHVIAVRDAKGIAAIEATLALHLGATVMAMPNGMTFFQIPNRDVIVTSTPEKLENGIQTDIHTMAFDVKEMTK